MTTPPPRPPTDVVVIRHPKERISKCSLRTLHDRAGFTFHKATKTFRYDATGHVLLRVGAPPISEADAGHPLLLLDSTWRWLPQLEQCIDGEPIQRSIPAGVETAYPRVSRNYEDPDGGLASVEALYVALRCMGHDDPTLLDGYHWKDAFLAGLG